MRVLRGRAATVEGDRAVVAEMLERTAETGEPAVRAWRPHRHLAFGRRDAVSDGYERASRVAERLGYRPVQRSVGGRAVAYTGRTVSFGATVPVADQRVGLDARYEWATDALAGALRSLGVDAEDGEPPDSFCPGQHSLQRRGKLAGVAQRIQRGAALVAGVVLPDDHAQVAAVLEPVYEALAVPFDPASVGSVAKAGGDGDPDTVARAVEEAFVERGAASVDDGGSLDDDVTGDSADGVTIVRVGE
ncbi:MAG: biotin/lipoate A/B protein ligase family protein [Haloferacaceae archaeon]